MKTVLITGISRGIGEATARKFLDEGFKVLGTSTSGEAEINHDNLKVFKLDLSNPEEILHLSKMLETEEIKLDVLVNNAAILLDSYDSFPLKREALEQTLQVNLIGTIELTEKLIPQINSGGHIINISSGNGSMTEEQDTEKPAYHISKAAINMYTKTLSGHLKDSGITVSSLDPGWVKTDMGGVGAQRDPQDPAEEIYHLATTEGIPTGQFWHQNKIRPW